MRSMSLKVEIIAGSSFADAFKDAKSLALQLDMMIDYSFNGVGLFVTKMDTLYSLEKYYDSQIKTPSTSE